MSIPYTRARIDIVSTTTISVLTTISKLLEYKLNESLVDNLDITVRVNKQKTQYLT